MYSSRILYASLLYGLHIFKEAYAFCTNGKGKDEVIQYAVLLIQISRNCKRFFGGGTEVTQIQLKKGCKCFVFWVFFIALFCFVLRVFGIQKWGWTAKIGGKRQLS